MFSDRDLVWEEQLNSMLAEASLAADVVAFSTVESTMDSARQVVKQLSAEISAKQRLLAVVAREQIKGRGREGRVWFTDPVGGLTVTYIAELPKLEPCLPLVVGVAVKRACQELGANVLLKWPNDIVWEENGSCKNLGSKKIGGILCESTSREDGPGEASRKCLVFIGIGLNINTEKFPESVLGASLRSVLGYQVPWEQAFLGLTKHLICCLTQLREGGFSVFREEYRSAQSLLGTKVKIESGRELVSGVVDDVSLDGGLVVISGDESRTVYSGTVVSYEKLLVTKNDR